MRLSQRLVVVAAAAALAGIPVLLAVWAADGCSDTPCLAFFFVVACAAAVLGAVFVAGAVLATSRHPRRRALGRTVVAAVAVVEAALLALL